MKTLVCWRCGASLQDLSTPLARLAQCKSCGADVHVCRMCRYYNPSHFEKCDHDMAEPAREVDVANFCHYFRATAQAYKPDDKQRAEAALDQLKALFGEEQNQDREDTQDHQQPVTDPVRARFEALFKKSDS
jgi:hypothetical protein